MINALFFVTKQFLHTFLSQNRFTHTFLVAKTVYAHFLSQNRFVHTFICRKNNLHTFFCHNNNYAHFSCSKNDLRTSLSQFTRFLSQKQFTRFCPKNNLRSLSGMESFRHFFLLNLPLLWTPFPAPQPHQPCQQC